eukprot:scaffold9352_cov123-Skeletonema_marinoi.AAC.2
MTLAPEGRGQATNLHAKHAVLKFEVPCHVIRDKIFCDKRYGYWHVLNVRSDIHLSAAKSFDVLCSAML